MTAEKLFQKGLDASRKSDYTTACSFFRQAAELGYASAQHELALCYYEGIGVEQDLSLHFSWEMKAAEQGYADAEYRIGCCYQDGDGVPEDDDQAATWFLMAAKDGHIEAHYEMGEYYDYLCDYEIAFPWYKKSADQGHLNGAYKTAVYYKDGTGTEQNYKEAMKYFKIVAESEDDAFDYPIEEAMCEIAWLYYYGQGVKKNEYTALEWFKKSVEQIVEFPKKKTWYEKVESLVNESGDTTVWKHLKKYIDETGRIIPKA